MNKEILYKIIKILILILVIYLVCRYIPEKTLSNSDILIIIMVIVALYIIFELLNKFGNGYQEQFAPYYQTPSESMMSIQKRMGSPNMDNQYTAGNPSILNNHTINPIEVSDNIGIPKDVDNSINQMTKDFKSDKNAQNSEK